MRRMRRIDQLGPHPTLIAKVRLLFDGPNSRLVSFRRSQTCQTPACLRHPAGGPAHRLTITPPPKPPGREESLLCRRDLAEHGPDSLTRVALEVGGEVFREERISLRSSYG